MQARTRVFLLLGTAAVASAVIALGFRSRDASHPDAFHSDSSAPAAIDLADSAESPSLDENDSPFAQSAVASMASASGSVGEDASAPVVAHSGQVKTAGTTSSLGAAPTAAVIGDTRVLVRDARQLLEDARPADAEAYALQAVQQSPTEGGAWNVLGRAQLALGRLADAEASFTQACTVDPNHAYAHNNLGLLHLQRGEWTQAATRLETAVRLKEDVAYFHNNLGLAYERLGRLTDAASAYQRAVDLKPNHSMARLSLTRVNARLQPSLAATTQAPPLDSVSSAATAAIKP